MNIKRFLDYRAAQKVADQIVAGNLLSAVSSKSKLQIPIIVVSYNNGPYLMNMVRQLVQRELFPLIIDNNSTDAPTLAALNDAQKMGAIVVRSPKNLRHLVGFFDPIYKLLPEIFAYTDPDLQFHPNLPDNFLQELVDLTARYECYKAGMALDITNFGATKNWKSTTTRKYPFYFHKEHDIVDWEHQFWTMPLKHERLEVYAAPIDTTFAVYQKKYFQNGDFSRGVRVAGNFAACHLPWYPHLDILSDQEQKNYIKDKSVGFR